MLNYVKNYILKSNLFWRYRQIIHKDVWLTYFDSYNVERRNFYSNYVNKHNCRSIFEFGCASGPNLKNIQSRVQFETFYFGFDINNAAIKLAKKKFNVQTSFFSNILTLKKIEGQLLSWKSSTFDLSIYDRVLYLLNESEVSAHFSKYGIFFKTVIIDDFHNSEFLEQDLLSHFSFATQFRFSKHLMPLS